MLLRSSNRARHVRENVRAKKARPCLVMSDYPASEELALVLAIPRPSQFRRNRFPNLLVNNLTLLVDHLPGEAIDRHVHPVVLFSFHDKVVLKATRIWFEPARLCDHIDQ
jgi:hypothetical protein